MHLVKIYRQKTARGANSAPPRLDRVKGFLTDSSWKGKAFCQRCTRFLQRDTPPRPDLQYLKLRLAQCIFHSKNMRDVSYSALGIISHVKIHSYDHKTVSLSCMKNNDICTSIAAGFLSLHHNKSLSTCNHVS